MWNAACAESDGFNAASIDVAFVDDGRIQVASHIDRTSRDQVKAPRHSAENRQRAGFCSFAGSTLFTFALVESSKISDRSGRVRPCSSTGAFSLLTITPVMLVFWHRRSCCGSVRYALSAVPGVSTLRHNEDDFRIQRFSDFVVQRLGKLVFTCRDQTFNQNDFSVFGVSVVVRDDLPSAHLSDCWKADLQRSSFSAVQRPSWWKSSHAR